MARLDRLLALLAGLFALDRLLKLAVVARAFRRPPPPAPAAWPSVALVQPLTRARHDLRPVLAARARLDYPAPLRHIAACDAADAQAQALARELLPGAEVLAVPPDGGGIADKISKLQAALARAGDAEVVVFVDDDVTLRPGALRALVAPLGAPGVGATFGLACYTGWGDLPTSLMSAFVNANALLSYLPLAALTEPYTITGHCFALRRETLAAAGAFDGLAGRIDDDHELARRVRSLGLRCEQTTLVYEVLNPLPSLAAYHGQMRRWFIFPRQAMLPFLTRRERAATALASAGAALPPLVAALALIARRPAGWAALAACLAAHAAAYAAGERYLGRATPAGRWPVALAVALVAPAHAALAALGPPVVEWRGRRILVRPGGSYINLG